jgi:uncharacterized membrane protein YedE/YeeE
MKSLFKDEWHWSIAGIMAGLTVMLAIIIGKNLAVAGAYVAVVRKILNIVNPEYLENTVYIGRVKGSDTWMVAMIGGIFLGGFVASKLSRTFQLHCVTVMWGNTFGEGVWRRAAVVFTGGLLLGLGANIGGGCTTGAFLTGVPTFSLGSIITSLSFFGAAILVANILYMGKDKQIKQISYQED